MRNPRPVSGCSLCEAAPRPASPLGQVVSPPDFPASPATSSSGPGGACVFLV